MLTYSSILTFTANLGKYFVIDDMILVAVFGGVINGIGMALCLETG